MATVINLLHGEMVLFAQVIPKNTTVEIGIDSAGVGVVCVYLPGQPQAFVIRLGQSVRLTVTDHSL